jgi:acyl dehydratase
MGILIISLQLLNQHGEVVQEGEHQLMIPRKPGSSQERT